MSFFFLCATDRVMNHHFECAAIHFVFFLYMISFSLYLNTRFFKVLCHILFIIELVFGFLCVRVCVCVSFLLTLWIIWSSMQIDIDHIPILPCLFYVSKMCEESFIFGWLLCQFSCACFFFLCCSNCFFFWEHNLSFNEKSYNSNLLKIF